MIPNIAALLIASLSASQWVWHRGMVAHSHPGMEPPAGHVANLPERRQEKLPVRVVVEHGFPAVALRPYIIEGPRVFDT